MITFGVQTHFAQNHDQAIIVTLAEVGIQFIRDEQYWQQIEKAKGIFTYPIMYASYMDKAKAAGLDVLVTLGWGNPFYDYEAGQFTAPHTEAGRIAFARYAVEILKKYPQIKAMEIWNEYNGDTFVKGPATTNKLYYYALMLKRVYEAVKAVRPDMQIAAGATSTVAHGFWRDLIEHGVLQYCDAVSVHYLGHIETEIDALMAVMGSNKKPIWVTEWAKTSGVTVANRETEVPPYLAQTLARMLSKGIKRVSWYLGMDYSSFPRSGLFAGPPEFTPHVAATAYSTAIKKYTGAIFRKRWPTSSSVYVLEFNTCAVMWSDSPVGVELTTSSPLNVTSMLGVETSRHPTNGKATLLLTREPQYATGSITGVVEINQKVLADSVSGYSGISSKNGWYYGYVNLASDATYHPSMFKALSWQPWGQWNYRWLVSSALYPFIDHIYVHPSDASWVIRRWHSNYTGSVRLKGVAIRGASGDGVRLRVFSDGLEKVNKLIAQNTTVTFDVPVDLQIGSNVDFAISKEGTMSFDATQLMIQVLKQ